MFNAKALHFKGKKAWKKRLYNDNNNLLRII